MYIYIYIRVCVYPASPPYAGCDTSVFIKPMSIKAVFYLIFCSSAVSFGKLKPSTMHIIT